MVAPQWEYINTEAEGECHKYEAHLCVVALQVAEIIIYIFRVKF